VDVGAPLGGTGLAYPRLGVLRLRRLAGGARLGEFRAQARGVRLLRRDRRSRAAAKEGAQPEGSRDEREQALHPGDATLPPLLATPVAPSPEAAQGGGADSVHEKEEFGPVNDYEIMLLLDPELAEERANEVIQRIRDAVDSGKGTWDGHEPWGRRRLAYEIDHKGEAVYHLLLFTAPSETLAEITRVLKITDGVMRHGAYRRVKGSGHTKAPAQIPVASAASASSATSDDSRDAAE
jgi:small subunit ribosomal protein S6